MPIFEKKRRGVCAFLGHSIIFPLGSSNTQNLVKFRMGPGVRSILQSGLGLFVCFLNYIHDCGLDA